MSTSVFLKIYPTTKTGDFSKAILRLRRIKNGLRFRNTVTHSSNPLPQRPVAAIWPLPRVVIMNLQALKSLMIMPLIT